MNTIINNIKGGAAKVPYLSFVLTDTLDINAYAPNVRACFMTDNNTELYFMQYNSNVYRYSLLSEHNMQGGAITTYAKIANNGYCLTGKGDGSLFYIGNGLSGTWQNKPVTPYVYYPYSVRTYFYDFPSQGGYPRSMSFSDDGLKFFRGLSTSDVTSWDLTIPFDITSAISEVVYSGFYPNISKWLDDGIFYVCCVGYEVNVYRCKTKYNLSDAELVSTSTLPVIGSFGFISNDLEYFYYADDAANVINQLKISITYI